MPGAHNKPLQTDERRAASAAFCKVTLAPLAAERQAVMRLSAQEALTMDRSSVLGTSIGMKRSAE